MTKFNCFVIGEDYKLVQNYSPLGKRKVNLFANIILLPVLMWLFSTFLMSYMVLGNSFTVSVMLALFFGLIIFIIERSIVMVENTPWIFWFRIGLGITVSILGAIAIDEVIFKADIDQKMQEYKTEFVSNQGQKVATEFSASIESQQAIVNQKYGIWQQRLDEANDEMKGRNGGSGNIGRGEIAEANLTMAKDAENNYDAENNKLAEMLTKQNSTIENAKSQAISNFQMHSLLQRIKAMYSLVISDLAVFIVYSLFTLFVFFIEFLVILFKKFSPESSDEYIQRMQQEMLKQRADKVFKDSAQFYSSEMSSAHYNNAQHLLRSHQASILN